MRILRVSCLFSLAVFSLLLLITSFFYSSILTKSRLVQSSIVLHSSINKYLPDYIFKSSRQQRESVPFFNYSSIPRRRKYAVTSSVQTSNYAYIAMTLGYSISKYNDLESMDADMVLLIRTEGENAITRENITNLQKVGWKIQIAQDLEFDGVDITDIRPWHRHNMNKLHLWTWTQYEKIVFVDADIVCKGSISDLFKVPGDLAAAPDVWWDILNDGRFNSGVLMLRPNMEEFRILSKAVSDPKMHHPEEADQAFLNNFYKFRFFGLPYKYNFNLVMVESYVEEWNLLWDEVIFLHFTIHKPRPEPDTWCLSKDDCKAWAVLEYFYQIYREMVEVYDIKGMPEVIH